MTTAPTTDPVTEAESIENNIATIVEDVASAAKAITSANALSALLGLLTALPGIVQLAEQFMGWANALSGNNPNALIGELGTALEQLRNAKTEADHAAAAKTLSGIISRLPS